ncbi:MAG: DUF2188 domain-containing protein [Longimicrobiales bacterium]
MVPNVYDVVPDRRTNGWRLELRGGFGSRVFSTRMEAVANGHERCTDERPASLIVYGIDGRVQERRTYAKV